jgi:signal transduction histidine kinase
MGIKQSLRYRITFFFVLFGTLLSGIIAIGVYLAVDDIEEKMLQDTLRLELDYFLNKPDKSLGTYEQISADSILYYVNEKQKQMVPDMIRDLGDGSHEILYEHQVAYHALITTMEDGTIYLIKNATPFERREINIHLALISAVVVAILTSLWLGIWLSGKVITPVKSLAKQVARLKPGSKESTKIAPQYAEDEVGQLASIFDSYQHKMEQFIQREQEFTADASHELRTPLTVINSAAELLLENPELPDVAKRQLHRIERAGERMSKMLEIFLLLAREARSADDTTLELCQVEDVARDVVEQHRFMLQDKPVDMHLEITSGFHLPLSRTALAIVLSNLVRNAINYTEQGEVVVKVADKQIEVRDTGIGIVTEDLESIFERNYRGNNAKNAGSGIGLSIVKRLCDRHNWDIDFQSEIGKGTTVTLQFYKSHI